MYDYFKAAVQVFNQRCIKKCRPVCFGIGSVDGAISCNQLLIVEKKQNPVKHE